MSDLKKPAGTQLPPAIDPDHIQEVAVNDILGIAVSDGTCALTLGYRRITERGNGREPLIERVVRARPVLTLPALNDMINKLMAIKAAIDRHNTLGSVPSPKPN